jgi:putative membrane-bound dehydrogenase-like protein
VAALMLAVAGLARFDAFRPQAVSATAAAQAPAPASASQAGAVTARPLRLLFLGHEQRNHNSHALFALLASPLARRGIQLTHVNTPAEALVPEKLAYYDGIVIYGNHETITPEQDKALSDFVNGGKALIALHSASFMFRQSPTYIPMVGGQFLRHGTGEFSAEIVQPNHPAMAGVQPFTTWDETYVHNRHNPVDRTVLMERVDAEGREPYTWVRTQGQGRVFYTAFGHDQRTWSNPGFHALVEAGIKWAVPEVARQAFAAFTMPQVAYAEGFNVPNYEQRNPAPKYQLPFREPDAAKFIVAPAEFDITLFASEPDIVKPIAFNFDERGRLWVIEALDYPNEMLGGAPGDDRIKILEDTNGDGKADKFTVFAEGLNLPTSIVFYKGGIIVSSAPNFLYLKDTNGDDKADVREVFSRGWGTNDTHAMASNLMYGHDNYVWGTVGYSGYNGEMNGKQMQFGQGMYRFKPDGTDFDYIAGATNNTWGLGLSETFDVFGSTANNDPSFHVAIPNRYFQGLEGIPNGTAGGRGVGPGYKSIGQFYPVHPMTPYIRQVDVFGGFTAGAGHQLYTARAFPKEFWNRVALIAEPTAHVLAQGALEKSGSGFVTRDGWNLMASAEEWFAPVHAQVGPDGAVWMADWYNFIIQHNPTPTGYSNGRGNAYESSLRDHMRGRIYRVAYKGAPAQPKRSLSLGDPNGLLSALASDNMFWRLHAQRLIIERGQRDLVPQLLALVRNRSVDSLGLNGAALHALWTLQGLGEFGATPNDAYRAAVDALKHPAAGVRKAAAMVLPKTPAAAKALIDAGALADTDLHTRLAVVLVLADMPQSPEIGPALFKASQVKENYEDQWLGRALYVAAMRHVDGFTEAARADKQPAQPFTSLPVALRLPTNVRPDWRAPAVSDITANWKDIQVPGNWETRGLPDFDGSVWFTRTFDAATTGAATVTLGQMRNTGEAWLNGQLITPLTGGRRGGGPPPAPAAAAPAAGAVVGRGAAAAPAAPAAAGAGRGGPGGALEVAAGVIRQGQNTLTVRITNPRNDGGFMSEPDAMFVQLGATRTPLAGTWKYRIERQTNAGPMYAGPRDLATHVAFIKAGGLASGVAAGVTLPAPGAPPAVPLTAVEQQRFNVGREVYSTICVSCHQPDGLGADKVAASIVGSPLALGTPSVPVRILLHGKQGTVGLMPALGTSLSDEQIASVLTYIRREWGHSASAVDPALVRETRTTVGNRTRPWTNDELAGVR